MYSPFRTFATSEKRTTSLQRTKQVNLYYPQRVLCLEVPLYIPCHLKKSCSTIITKHWQTLAKSPICISVTVPMAYLSSIDVLLPVEYLYEVGQFWQREGIPLDGGVRVVPEHQLAVPMRAAGIESDL